MRCMGKAIIRKWVGHKIDICEISGCSKTKKVRSSMGQLTVGLKVSVCEKQAYCGEPLTHSLTHLGNETCKAKPIMSSLQKYFIFLGLYRFSPTNFFFLVLFEIVTSWWDILSSSTATATPSPPPFYDKSLNSIHKVDTQGGK